MPKVFVLNKDFSWTKNLLTNESVALDTHYFFLFSRFFNLFKKKFSTHHLEKEDSIIF